jgi:small-conductance mechanosensitive channel
MRGAGSLATYLGLVSAALVIALQDPISNFVGWVFIVSRRPFEIEDRIQIGEDAGDVIDIRFFQFSLLEIGNWVDADQSTGRVLHIPNRRVFAENVANYSQGFSYIWNEIAVVVTFESDWRKAKHELLAIAQRHAAQASSKARERIRRASKRYLIYYKNLTPIVYTKVIDYGITLTIRYLCAPQRRRSTTEAIWEDVLTFVAGEPTIEFAYPTQRIYYHPVEGPPELGPKRSGGAGGSEGLDLSEGQAPSTSSGPAHSTGLGQDTGEPG